MCLVFYFVFLYQLHFLSVCRIALWEHSLTMGSTRISPKNECGRLFCWVGLHLMLMGLWLSHVQNSVCKKRGENGMSIMSFWTLNWPFQTPMGFMGHYATYSHKDITTGRHFQGNQHQCDSLHCQMTSWKVNNALKIFCYFLFLKTQQKVDICQVCLTKPVYRKKDKWEFVSLFMNSPAYY